MKEIRYGRKRNHHLRPRIMQKRERVSASNKKINRRRARKLNHPAWRMFSCTVICSANVDKRRRADKKGRANSVTNKIARQLSAGRKKKRRNRVIYDMRADAKPLTPGLFFQCCSSNAEGRNNEGACEGLIEDRMKLSKIYKSDINIVKKISARTFFIRFPNNVM